MKQFIESENIIEIENLSFRFPDGRHALEDINLVIGPGESVALMGANGAGKSTLLLHLNGILQGTGSVKVLSRSVNDSNLKFIRSKVGLVFQDPDDQLFSSTVFDDVAFGPVNLGWDHERVHQAVHTALEQVGLGGYENRIPHHLSFGEKKRVAIATVLSMAPEVIVLDEPTSNLDPVGQWRLIKLLRSLDVTKIIATHDLQLVKAMCERVVLLDKGRAAADGPSAQILNDTDLLVAHGMLAGEMTLEV